jgi:hypothetical protein
MKQYQLKQLSGSLRLKFAKYSLNGKNYSTSYETDLLKNLTDAGLEFNRKQIDKKEIKTITEVDISAETYWYEKKVKTLHFDVKTDDKKGLVSQRKLSVDVSRISGKSFSLINQYEYNRNWSPLLGLISIASGFFSSKTNNVDLALGSLITAIGTIHTCINAVRLYVKNKKLNNVLMAIAAFEKGIQAIEIAEKAKRKL